MSGSGDLVGVLSLEDFEFRSGLREAANETRKFAKDVAAVGNRAGADMGRAAGQIGFALQDFSSVLSMGGRNALGRALMSTMNNVQMLGMAFGPWGLAITAVGGALGSMLIPKLLEGETASEDFAKSIDVSTKALDRLLSKESASFEFVASLNKLNNGGTAGDVSAAGQKNQRHIDDLQNQIKTHKDALGGMIAGAAQRGAIVGFNGGKLDSPILDEDKIGKDAGEKILAEQEKIKDLEDSLARAERRAEALGEAMNGAMQQDRIKQEREEAGKLADQMENIRKASRTPGQTLTDDLNRMVGLAKMGGNVDILSAGMDASLKTFAGSVPKPHHMLAGTAQEGSAEAMSAVNRAVAATNVANPALDQAKKQVDLAKQQLELLRRIAEKNGNVIPVNLGV